MLEIKNLYAGYGGGDIIKDISFTADGGEVLCIAGPNGCGKSTLLKSIARLLPYRGSITVNGQDALRINRKDLAKKIALLGQLSPVYFPYTVYDTVAMGRYAHTRGFFKNLSADDRAIITETITRLELDDVRDQLITQLSGGQLQRVFLARTLAQDPDIILLDEPTNHLDLKHQVELLQYLSAWAVDRGKAIVAVLHDLNLVHRFSGRAVLMCRGMLAACGKSDEVLNSGVLREVYGMDIRAFMRESLEKWI
jgi:iron complex transport system ATP-binding protein